MRADDDRQHITDETNEDAEDFFNELTDNKLVFVANIKAWKTETAGPSSSEQRLLGPSDALHLSSLITDPATELALTWVERLTGVLSDDTAGAVRSFVFDELERAATDEVRHEAFTAHAASDLVAEVEAPATACSEILAPDSTSRSTPPKKLLGGRPRRCGRWSGRSGLVVWCCNSGASSAAVPSIRV